MSEINLQKTSRLIYRLQLDNSIVQVPTTNDAVSANCRNSTEYCFIAERWLPSDSVAVVFNRPDGRERRFPMRYDNIVLENGVSIGGWFVVTDGTESNINLTEGTADLIIGFNMQRLSQLDPQVVITESTTGTAIVSVQPGLPYVAFDLASDSEIIIADIAALDTKIYDISEDLNAKMSEAQQKSDIALSMANNAIMKSDISVAVAQESVAISDIASAKASEAVAITEQFRGSLETALVKATNAENVANGIAGTVEDALQKANESKALAQEVKTDFNDLQSSFEEFKDTTSAKVNQLEQDIVSGQGTTVLVGAIPVSEFNADLKADKSYVDGLIGDIETLQNEALRILGG